MKTIRKSLMMLLVLTLLLSNFTFTVSAGNVINEKVDYSNVTTEAMKF